MLHINTNTESLVDMVKDIDPTRTILLCVFYLVQVTFSAILLVTTPKRSILRKLWTPLSFLLFFQLFVMSKSYTGGLVRFNQGAMAVLLTAINAFNLMHMNPLDRTEIATKTGASPDNFFSCLFQSMRLLFGLRGCNTPWQVKGIPAHPSYPSKKGTASTRGPFLLRQCMFLSWQWLALDTFSVWSCQIAATNVKPSSTSLPLIARITMTLATWFALARLVIDSLYRFGAIIAVALGDDPYSWPPVMGSMWDAYTLRNFWGKFWHQLMRWPLTSISNFISRDIMKLSRPSVLERYVNITLVFLSSGIIHVISDKIQGISFEKSGSITFFLGCALGIMIEDGVRKAFSVLTGTPYSPGSDVAPRLWKRIIGYLWVIAWLSLLSPSHLMPLTDLPKENRWFVPISFVEHMGVGAATKGLVAGAVILVLHFEAAI